MNTLETTIRLTLEVQMTNKLPFLDCIVEQAEANLITCIYHKSTDTGLYLKWLSNQPKIYEINLIQCLFNRAVRIYSSETLLKRKLNCYKKILLANSYPFNVIKKVVRKFELKKYNTSKKNNNIRK